MKLFLTSYFKQVAPEFIKVYGEGDGKKAVFIPTASIPEKMRFYVSADRNALKKLGFEVEDLEITGKTEAEIHHKIMGADLVFVCGGNSFFLLQEMRRKKVDKILRRFLADKDKFYIGSSAGSVVCCPDIKYVEKFDDTSAAPDLKDNFAGMNLVDFYVLPHFGEFPFAKVAEKTFAEYQDKVDMRAISNAEGILVDGNKTRVLKVLK
jgi:dipeptidase E